MRTRKEKNMLGHRLAAMAWFQALSQQEKLTGDGLEKRFMPKLALSKRRSNIFYKYKDGSAFPEKTKNYLIYRNGPRAVEFNEHMLWHRKYIELEMLWLYRTLFELIDKPANSLFYPPSHSADVVDAVAGDRSQGQLNYLLLRKDDHWISRLDRLRSINTLDSWEGILFMLRQYKSYQKPDLVYLYCCYLLLDMWKIIYTHPILGPFAENIYTCIEYRFCPELIPSDASGHNWVKVVELHNARIADAQAEIPGWSIDKATITSMWYQKLTTEINTARERRKSLENLG
jgi:hypothetical protein